MGLKIALTYNLKRKISDAPADLCSEFDSPQTITAIKNALEQLGHQVFLVEADRGLIPWFSQQKVDFVFNIAEGACGGSREAQIPAILDFLNIPYTGSGVLTLTLSLNKALTKKILLQENIPTPKFRVFNNPAEVDDTGLNYPLIVKPNCEGSAKGIHASSVVESPQRLLEEVRRVVDTYKQDALVEEFIQGKELTVGILGNDPLMVLPALEIDFSTCSGSGEYFYSWRMKEFQGNKELKLTPEFYCPARLLPAEYEAVCETAKKVYRAVGCRDFGRIDFRLSEEGIPYVLEINPLPGLDPEESNLTRMTRSQGMNHIDLIRIILENALARHNIVTVESATT